LLSTPCYSADPFAPLVAPVEQAQVTTGNIAKTFIKILMAAGILAGIWFMTKGNVSEGLTVVLLVVAIGTILLLVL
jgi:hypothetical protein